MTKREYSGYLSDTPKYSKEVFNEKEVFESLLLLLFKTHRKDEAESFVAAGKKSIEEIKKYYKLSIPEPKDRDDIKKYRQEWKQSYRTNLESFSSLNQQIEKSIQKKQNEAKRREWNNRPETARKKVERATRNTFKFFFTLAVSFAFITALLSVPLVTILAGFGRGEVGFLTAMIIAIPISLSMAGHAVKEENQNERINQ